MRDASAAHVRASRWGERPGHLGADTAPPCPRDRDTGYRRSNRRRTFQRLVVVAMTAIRFQSPTLTPDLYDLLRPPPALEYSHRFAKDASGSLDAKRAIIVRYEDGHVLRHGALGPAVLLPRGGFNEPQWRDPTGAPRRLLVAARGVASIEAEQEP